MPEERKKISPAVGVGLALGVGAVLYFALKAKAAPPIPPADIVISDLIIEPAEVYVGGTVSITVVATNIGETAGSYEVTCEVE